LGLLFLLLFCGTLSSFSGVPAEKKPPHADRRTQQLHKKEARLHRRLKHARTPRSKHHWNRKLRHLQQQQGRAAAPSFLLGLLSLIAGAMGIAMTFIAVVSSVALAFSSGVNGTLIVGIYVGIALALGIAGLVLSILYFSKRKKDPSAYTQPAFAIIGIILSSIVTTIGFILVFGMLSTL
jgi:hypothetical protein